MRPPFTVRIRRLLVVPIRSTPHLVRLLPRTRGRNTKAADAQDGACGAHAGENVPTQLVFPLHPTPATGAPTPPRTEEWWWWGGKRSKLSRASPRPRLQAGARPEAFALVLLSIFYLDWRPPPPIRQNLTIYMNTHHIFEFPGIF
ncbi:hypothetical protein C8R44DRAFT_893772 [Mycena epipterygia]|nr:hypothetical protein C8R44DRAFT_893772 [Mycena epipterygia]